MTINDPTEFNRELISVYAKHWIPADTETKVGMMYALCLALASSITFLADGDEQQADAACMVAEAHIRNTVQDFITTEKQKKGKN
jgi:hypothetical protein